jgi:hypothetical protein
MSDTDGGMAAMAEAAGESARAAELPEQTQEPAVTHDSSSQKGKKRKRRTKMEMAVDAEKKANAELQALKESMLEQLNAGHSMSEKAMQTLAQKIESAQATFDAATKTLHVQTAIAEVEKKKAEEKAEKDAKEREGKMHLSDAAAIHLVTLRIKHDKHITDTVEKNDKVWDKHIHPEYMAAVTSGQLQPSDERTVEGLKTRWGTELAEFCMWAAVANRAHELSGVPRDELLGSAALTLTKSRSAMKKL